MTDETSPTPQAAPDPRPLSTTAQRALAEAQARRAEIDRREQALKAERELNGRGGLDPVRYDDWEVKGIASDF